MFKRSRGRHPFEGHPRFKLQVQGRPCKHAFATDACKTGGSSNKPSSCPFPSSTLHTLHDLGLSFIGGALFVVLKGNQRETIILGGPRKKTDPVVAFGLGHLETSPGKHGPSPRILWCRCRPPTLRLGANARGGDCGVWIFWRIAERMNKFAMTGCPLTSLFVMVSRQECQAPCRFRATWAYAACFGSRQSRQRCILFRSWVATRAFPEVSFLLATLSIQPRPGNGQFTMGFRNPPSNWEPTASRRACETNPTCQWFSFKEDSAPTPGACYFAYLSPSIRERQGPKRFQGAGQIQPPRDEDVVFTSGPMMKAPICNSNKLFWVGALF